MTFQPTLFSFFGKKTPSSKTSTNTTKSPSAPLNQCLSPDLTTPAGNQTLLPPSSGPSSKHRTPSSKRSRTAGENSSFNSSPLSKKATSVSTKEKNVDRQWLLDVKDSDGRRPTDPEYDNKTLFVPQQALNKMTNFERQFWGIKCCHFDCILFFQKGSFYELYERDADIAMQHFNFKVSDNGRGSMRMAGFPSSCFDEWAAKFLALGYRVARVDQAQPEPIVTKTTAEKTRTPIKSDSILQRELKYVLSPATLVEPDFISTPDSIICMSVGESANYVAATYIDVASSKMYFASAERDQLVTLLCHTKPRELILSNKVSTNMLRYCKGIAPLADIVKLPDHDPLTSRHVIKSAWHNTDMPSILADLAGFSNSDFNEETDLFASSLSRLLAYIERLKRSSILESVTIERWTLKNSHHMFLDGSSLSSLNVLTGDKSLFSILNRTSTAGGRRLLQHWLRNPLRDATDIKSRQRVIQELMSNSILRLRLISMLDNVPDIERSLSIQARKSLPSLNKSIQGLYNGILLLQHAIKHLSCPFIADMFKGTSLQEISNVLDNEFKSTFNTTDSSQCQLSDSACLKATERVEKIRRDIHQLKQRVQKHSPFDVKLKEVGKEYYFEVPIGCELPGGSKISSTTRVVRYSTREIAELNLQLSEANLASVQTEQACISRLQTEFTKYSKFWREIAFAVSTLDVVISLAKAAIEHGFQCVPRIVEGVAAFVNATDFVHPCFLNHVPNNIDLGYQQPRTVLLTGCNMAGKSTMQRTVGILVIMAQIGSLLPASRFDFSPFDSLYTRIGANDELVSGMSTLMVEMSEMSRIINHCTISSLLLIDELGRGTSTFDGLSIAFASLSEVVAKNALCIFATHYHSLEHDFNNKLPLSKINKMRMAVESNDGNSVKFLYKLVNGVADSSLGLAIAELAGISNSVLNLASKKAKEMEQQAKQSEVSVSFADLSEFKNLWQMVL